MKRISILALVLILGGFANKDEVLSIIKAKVDDYYSKYNRAKLELFFSQPQYVAGDTARVRITYVRAKDLKQIQEKQIVHICLFDQYGNKAISQWTSIRGGFGNFEWVIPNSFPDGNYKLVAFTDWMKNLDPSLFFQQKFVVSGKYTLKKIEPKDSVVFSPEGGHLIANVNNNLAIRYQGTKRTATISIKENGKPLASLDLVRDSVAVFKIAPKPDAIYLAEIQESAGIKKFELPHIELTGISIQLETLPELIRLNIENVGHFSDTENYFVLLLNNNGLIFQTQIDFDNSQKTILEFPGNLPRGIAQLILIDSKFDLKASRVIFIGDLKSRKVKIDKILETYSTRQLLNFNLKLEDSEQFNVGGAVSCRIINDDLLKNTELGQINYLTFYSDISNTFRINELSASRLSLNNYLITQTCPWFNWKKIVEDDKTPPVFKYQEYMNLSGTATNVRNGKPLRDSTLLMFFLQKSMQGYETYVSSKGKFSFSLFLPITRSDIFFYAASFEGNDVFDLAIKIQDPDSSLTFFAEPWSEDKSQADPYSVYAIQRNSINSSYSFFSNHIARNDSLDEPNKAIEDELNGADLTVTVSDYLMMPTMIEVIREILKAVEYRKINGRDVVRVYTTAKKPTNTTGPLYVIDGMITKDPANFISLKPKDVISIKVVKDSRKLFPLGKLGENGVIIVKTRLKEPIAKEKNQINLTYLFPQPDVSPSIKLNPQLPDLKSCLLWVPKIILKANEQESLQFYTTDDLGRFKIQFYGLTEDGNPIYSEYPFQVKYLGN